MMHFITLRISLAHTIYPTSHTLLTTTIEKRQLWAYATSQKISKQYFLEHGWITPSWPGITKAQTRTTHLIQIFIFFTLPRVYHRRRWHWIRRRPWRREWQRWWRRRGRRRGRIRRIRPNILRSSLWRNTTFSSSTFGE